MFADLDEKNSQVIVPAIVLSEYLTPVPADRHRSVIASLSKRFVIAPFDVRCASLAATLYSKGGLMRKKSAPNKRKVLRADCLIIATASVHGARVLYSGDKDCRKLAEKIARLTAMDLPTIPPDLWGYDNSEA